MRYQSKEEKLDTKKIRGEEKVARQQIDDTSSFAHKAETIIQQLCDEVDRLKEKVSDQATLLHEQNDCISDLMKTTDQGKEKQLREAVQVQMRRNRRQYRKIQELEKAPQSPTRVGKIIDEQEKEIAGLMKRLRTTHGIIFSSDKVKSNQQGEIAELKAELAARTQVIWDSDNAKAGQRGEIAELKKSLGNAREVIRGNGKALVGQQEEITELKEELATRTQVIWDSDKARQKLTKAIKGIIDEWKILRCSVNGKPYPDIAQLKIILDVYGAK